MKKLLAITLITTAMLGLSGCMVISCEEHRHPRRVHVVSVPPRPPHEVIIVPGPPPHHHPPIHMHCVD